MNTKNKRPAKRRNGITLAALALALGGAVYLNWSYAQGMPETVAASTDAFTETSSAMPQDAVAVVDPLSGEAEEALAEPDSANKNYGEAQLVSVNQDSGTEFFEQARLARTKARDEALDTLNDALKNSELTQEEKDSLTNELNARLNNITVESALETLIKAKGLVDCVVMLDGDKAQVTVMTENDALTAEEVTRIRDVILTKCKGIAAQNITVVEVK